ncbi:MAG: twin-arginine translocase TatA/TatE family subunit [Pseudomonadota bacterium]|nr:twin-arginine translocase TatA/TatE family subunit [Pseudomonadota bacterium]MEC8977677.1 twin-arginine translocase TatA/TatE family subunit [Pseudomonadota bacterium]|tara:strand:+ start:4359 stop:4532 length:174 start_codon:yes stop_codon:yes gene_type:complete
MGFAGMSPGSLLLIFFIALLVFGPNKLQSLGKELGEAIRAFRKGLEEDESVQKNTDQ